MDERRIDELARSLAAGGSRRRFLAGLGGLAAGLLGAGVRRAGAVCPPDQAQAADRSCVCRATGLPPGPNGCSCPAGQARCGGACTALGTAANCTGCADACSGATPVCGPGGCVGCLTGADCAAGAPPNTAPTCAGGAGSYPCAPGYHDCGDTCASDRDPATCGDRCTPCPSTHPECAQSVEGQVACTTGPDVCLARNPCSADEDCRGAFLTPFCRDGLCVLTCTADDDCLATGWGRVCGSRGYCVTCEESRDCYGGVGGACVADARSAAVCVGERACHGVL